MLENLAKTTRTALGAGLGFLVFEAAQPYLRAQETTEQEQRQERRFLRLNPITEAVNLGGGLTRTQYESKVDEYFQQQYPRIDTNNEGYRFLVRKSAFYVKLGRGNITSRINPLIQKYNLFIQVASVTNETNLPTDFEQGLIDFYGSDS